MSLVIFLVTKLSTRARLVPPRFCAIVKDYLMPIAQSSNDSHWKRVTRSFLTDAALLLLAFKVEVGEVLERWAFGF